jgi:hypothetical protein
MYDSERERERTDHLSLPIKMLNRTERHHRRAVDRWGGQFLAVPQVMFQMGGEPQWHVPRSSDFPESVLAVLLSLWFDRVDGVDAREEGILSVSLSPVNRHSTISSLAP